MPQAGPVAEIGGPEFLSELCCKAGHVHQVFN
jgi:hypothetical protein